MNANALAGLADNLTLNTPTGAVSFATTDDTDSTAKASGSATKGASANIGAAVAINVIKVQNLATLGVDDIVNSSGLTLSAAMAAATGAAPDGKYTLDTEATAGGGNGKVGIAGSLALELADIVTSAEIKANQTRGPPDQINGKHLPHRGLVGLQHGQGHGDRTRLRARWVSVQAPLSTASTTPPPPRSTTAR